MFNFENIFANLTYTKQVNTITNKALLTGVNQVSSSVNMPSNFPNESLSGFGSYGRSFLRYFKADVNAQLSWSKNNNIRILPDNDTDPTNNPAQYQTTKSFTQNYGFSFSTNLKNAPNLEFNYDYTINDFQSQVYYVDNPSVTLEYYF